jgi:hypothetical protein
MLRRKAGACAEDEMALVRGKRPAVMCRERPVRQVTVTSTVAVASGVPVVLLSVKAFTVIV